MAHILVLALVAVVSAVAGVVSSYLYLRANPKEAAKIAAVVNQGAQVVGNIEKKL